MTEVFLICDLRREWCKRPYVTFWRPNNANYAYPLSWAGDYSRAEIDANADYYTEFDRNLLVRFAVPRDVAEALAEAPTKGDIDGDAGPVVRHTALNQRKLREAAYVPEAMRLQAGGPAR